MTQWFILDENIVIYAQLETNERGERDLTCARLVSQIIVICHTLVVDHRLLEQYLRQLNRRRLQHPQQGPLLLRVLNEAIQRPAKVDCLNELPPEFPEEVDIPQGSRDDIPVIRLAVQTRATLVTTDRDLRSDLTSCGVQERYGLVALSPAEALEAL